VFENQGIEITAKLANDIKDIGFEYATESGLSFALSDMIEPDTRD